MLADAADIFHEKQALLDMTNMYLKNLTWYRDQIFEIYQKDKTNNSGLFLMNRVQSANCFSEGFKYITGGKAFYIE